MMINKKSLKNIGLFLAILVAPNVIPRASFMKMLTVRISIISLLAVLMLENSVEIITAVVLGTVAIILLQKSEGFMLGPNTDVLVSCHNVKYQDILDKFGGDEEEMKSVLYNDAHLPMNIPVTDDYYAPLVATYLVNYDNCKYEFGDCRLPRDM